VVLVGHKHHLAVAQSLEAAVALAGAGLFVIRRPVLQAQDSLDGGELDVVTHVPALSAEP
jgi:hypothetical protein